MVALVHQIGNHPSQQRVGNIRQRNVLPQFSFRPCTVYDLADQKIHRPVFLLFRYPLPQKISLLGMICQQMQKRLHSAELQLGHAAALTGSLDPYKVLARGYTMVTAANGTILNADDLQPEKTIYVRSASRRAKCRVEAVEEINENTQKF